MSVEDILKLMQSPTVADAELISKAYAFTEKAHQGQKRYSGEPYFIHPIETAKNLAEIGMGSKTIAAGLLHDTLEDAAIKPQDLQNEFGEEILFLVDGVTKLGKLRYHGHERHIESLRKLFIAMSQDIRVLIIKLADRLHNMRTIEHVPKIKQKRIASETLEIYAPLAYRLGIRKFTRELQDLSFQNLDPRSFQKVENILKEQHEENLKRLQKFSKSIRKELAIKDTTILHSDFRIKGIYSLYRKLDRKDWDVGKIYDIAALRVIVPNVADCYRALGIIHGVWRPLPGRIKDYIAFPKPNGYQSLHTTIFMGDGGIIEVQIRTEEMHLKAEYGIASHIAYKEKQGGISKKREDYFVWIKHLLPGAKNDNAKKAVAKTPYDPSDIPNWIREMAEAEIAANEGDEFIKNLKTDFLQERMFVFTPKGDVIDLPTDSTPIDFAYAIHSDIGNHMAGAKVNGKQVSLDTKIKNGDTVEIQIRNNSRPTEKWLASAKTTTAQKHIRLTLQELKLKQRK